MRRDTPQYAEHVAVHTPGGRALAVDGCSAVALFLLIERLLTGPASKWAPYIAALPPLDAEFNIPQLEWEAGESGRAALAVLVSSPSAAAMLANATAAHREKLQVGARARARSPSLTVRLNAGEAVWVTPVFAPGVQPGL